jgi:hypothetical protein
MLLAFPVTQFNIPLFEVNGSVDNLNVKKLSKVAPPRVIFVLQTDHQAFQFQPAFIRSTEYAQFT